MTEKNYGSQPEKQLSPEEQLDLLLEKFLNDPNDEIPTVEDLMGAPEASEEVTEDAPTLSDADADDRFESLWDEADIAETEDGAQMSMMPDLAPLAEAEEVAEDEACAEEEVDEVIAPIAMLPEDEEEPEEPQEEDIEEAAEEEADEEEAVEDVAPIAMLPEDEEKTEEPQDEEIEEAAEEEADEEEANEAIVPVVMLPEDEEEPEEPQDEEIEEAAEEEADEEEADEAIAPVVMLPEDEEKAEEPQDEEIEETFEDEAVEDVAPIVMLPEDEEEHEEPQDEEIEEAAEEEADEEEADEVIVPVVMLPEDEEEPEEPQEEDTEETAEESQAEAAPAEDPAEDASSGNDAIVANPPAAVQPQPPAEDEEDWDEEDDEEWDEEEYEEEEDEVLPPPKKRRPRNNKKYGLFGIPHIMTTLVWLGIIVFIGVGLGQLIWNCAADVLALGREDSEVAITIDESDDLKAVANKLHTLGLIRYPSLFVIYGDISDAMESIRVGSYTLNTLYDYHALVDAMSSNQRRITTNVTIPEGYTCAQIFKLLETKGVSTVAKLEAAAANGELGDYWFLEGVEQGTANCLEGFLFPDTYTFYLDHDPVSVLKKFLDNFNKRFNESMQIKLDTLNANLSEMMRTNGLSEEYIAEHQMTVRDVVIIASMIEKETASAPESYNISSVIYNRLTNPNGETAGYLQIDATLVYINGGNAPTGADKEIDSPYNTYLYKGLPAGPISNPGSFSLDAALDPTATEYYFYALDPSTGEHHFSKTLKEHNDFLESIRKEEEPEDTDQ